MKCCAGSGCTWAQAPLALLLTAKLQSPGVPAGHNPMSSPDACRVVARMALRSSAPSVVAALQADMPAFLADLFGGALLLGFSDEGLPSAVQVPPAAVRALMGEHASGGLSDGREAAAIVGAGGLESAILRKWQRIRAATVLAG